MKYIDILILYFMTEPTLKLTELHQGRHKELSPPTTPRKKPRFSDQDSNAKPRVKSITKSIESQSANSLYYWLLISWTLFALGAVLLSYQSKMQEAKTIAVNQIQKCHEDYTINNCQYPVSGARVKCAQFHLCRQQDPQQLALRTFSHFETLGEILKEFISGAGIAGVAIGIVIFWLALKQKGRSKTIIYVEYFDK